MFYKIITIVLTIGVVNAAHAELVAPPLFPFPSVEEDSVRSSTTGVGPNDVVGEFEIEFEVTAIGQNWYLSDSTFETAAGSDPGIYFGFNSSFRHISSVALNSTTDEPVPNWFEIKEGESETFRLSATFQTEGTEAVRMFINQIVFSTVIGGDTYQAPLDSTVFRTTYQSINGSTLPAPVPVPGAIWLLGSAMIGLVSLKRT